MYLKYANEKCTLGDTFPQAADPVKNFKKNNK